VSPRSERREQDRLDALRRLDSLVLRQTEPEAWRESIRAEVLPLTERWAKAPKGPQQTRALADLYRATRRAFIPSMPAEAFFYMLAAHLHVEAHCGPDALLHQKDYLGPLWHRLEAIRRRHRWPENDEDGDLWCPEEHIDPLPADYVAWREELEQALPAMERASLRAVCQKYGVPEIADMKETDPTEFKHRCDRGRRACDDMAGPDGDGADDPVRGGRESSEAE